MRLLLKNGSNPNSQDITGRTPLHDAAHHGHLEIVKLLLESGAYLDLRNHEDETPFDIASANAKWELTKFLVDVDSSNDTNISRSDLGSQRPPPDVMLPSPDHEEHVGFPPDIEKISLHKACMEGNPDVIQSLIDRGTDVTDAGLDSEQT